MGHAPTLALTRTFPLIPFPEPMPPWPPFTFPLPHLFFFLKDPAPTEFYPLPLPDALPIPMTPLPFRPAAVAAVSLLAAAQPGGRAPAHLSPRAQVATALFAGGCFWSMEHPFDQVRGVLAVSAGYTGGPTNNPPYEGVPPGWQGHCEAGQLNYDQATVRSDE